jgi:hypothetical protein
MSEPDFPDGFQGAGPMFAAVPLGNPWHDLAVRGVTTYIPESAAQAGPDCAFLDREQAEQVADACTDGELTRYEGLTGWNDRTAARAEADRLAGEAYAEMLASPEWPADVRMASETDVCGCKGQAASFEQWLLGGQQPEAGS